MRMILRPADFKSKEKLLSDFGVKSISPLDICLGIDGLPCKMSIGMMLKCAFWAQNQCSYQLAEETMGKVFGYTVNDDTIRQVTNFIGRLVFEEDCRLAEEAWQLLESGKMNSSNSKMASCIWKMTAPRSTHAPRMLKVPPGGRTSLGSYFHLTTFIIGQAVTASGITRSGNGNISATLAPSWNLRSIFRHALSEMDMGNTVRQSF